MNALIDALSPILHSDKLLMRALALALAAVAPRIRGVEAARCGGWMSDVGAGSSSKARSCSPPISISTAGRRSACWMLGQSHNPLQRCKASRSRDPGPASPHHAMDAVQVSPTNQAEC